MKRLLKTIAGFWGGYRRIGRSFIVDAYIIYCIVHRSSCIAHTYFHRPSAQDFHRPSSIVHRS